MIERIEFAKSDRGRCTRCKKIIGKGTPRGISYYHYKDHWEHHYYFYKCSKIEIKELMTELNKSIKKSRKEIILMEMQ